MRLPIALFSLALLLNSPVRGQLIEASVYGGSTRAHGEDLGRFGFAQQPITLENGFKTGVRLSLNSGPLTGHELSYGYERYNLEIGGQTESKASVQQFFYDFVVHFTPRSVSIRPFVLAGAGYANFSPGDGGVFAGAGGTNEFGVNFGGGLKIKMHRFFGIRFDVRDHLTRKPNFLDLSGLSGGLHRMEYSAGASFLF
ncbi:MAG: outer membrane beta-barrel protein [Acidobacteria bacterium]|nr:outer membrane beta-barrel protein [Acidobacteriota bacterium]